MSPLKAVAVLTGADVKGVVQFT
nr:RecName: Full=Superoxide dismutase [Cu-Zn] 2; AltName: Full=Superoxide dismutase [Cu-Zn] II; Short=SOD II [Picea abies]